MKPGTEPIHKLPRPACQDTLHVRPPYQPRTLFKTYPFSGPARPTFTQFLKNNNIGEAYIGTEAWIGTGLSGQNPF